MAVVNTLASNLVNLDSTPPVIPAVSVNGSRCRAIVDTVSVAAADDDTSVYRLARIHSSWIIPFILVFNDAITNGTSYDLGIYQTAENGGAVVSAQAYASAVTMASASTVGVNLAFEARDITKINNRVWQDAGLSADSNRFYDLGLGATTVGTVQGDISVFLQYLSD